MKKHKPVSDEEYSDILQWLKEEIGFNESELAELSDKEIIRMRDTYLFQRWRLKKACYEFKTAMKETKLGSVIISITEFLDRCFDKIFGWGRN